MYRYILLLSLLWVGPSYAQGYIPQGYMGQPHGGQQSMGRDFVYQYRVPPKTLIPEEQYMLKPQDDNSSLSQGYRPQPYSNWMGRSQSYDWNHRLQQWNDQSVGFIWDYNQPGVDGQ